MKLPDRKILLTIAVLALALTIALVWTSSGEALTASATPAALCADADFNAALGSPEDAEGPLSPLPDIPDGGAERELFEKLQDALDDAFNRFSAERVYERVVGKTVDLSWKKAVAVFASR